jgi:thymidylate synthase
MADSYFSGPTVDDVMHDVFEAIQSRGCRISPGKGPAAELVGTLIEVTNPRARLSRTEERGRPFGCLGELCWYLAGSNSLDFISYYLPKYEKSADGNIIFGGYGPRLFDWKGLNQLANVTDLLRRRPDSRRAVVQLFDATDILEEHNDVPCTCTLQFILRKDELHLFANMRSNDAFLGLPHDIFSFTMLQEIMARTLSVELGTYKHAVGSLHLYDPNADAAQRFLNEGWQSTEMPMPPMPLGDPWPSIRLLLEAEAKIRAGGQPDSQKLKDIDPYWEDFVRMLQIFKCKKDKNTERIRFLACKMSSPVYSPFINKHLSEV